jgi:TonB family protein
MKRLPHPSFAPFAKEGGSPQPGRKRWASPLRRSRAPKSRAGRGTSFKFGLDWAIRPLDVLKFQRMLRRIPFLLLISTCLLAADSPKRIEPQVAEQNLTKKVDPTVPPLAKAVEIGGTVLLEITITPQGKVGSVKVLSGHPMLAPAFVDAVRKGEYKPFVQDGQAISVVTTVEWNVPSPTRTNAEQKALKDYYPTFQTCYQMVRQGKNSDAEKECSEAVTLSDGLPAGRLIERSSSRTFLAHALMAERKPDEAIPLYQKALEIRKGVEHSERDADFASEYANLARAYFITGQLDKADALYQQAVTIFEAAIVDLPDMRDNYTSRLKSTLLEYAKLKSARGDVDAANALDQRAAGLQDH